MPSVDPVSDEARRRLQRQSGARYRRTRWRARWKPGALWWLPRQDSFSRAQEFRYQSQAPIIVHSRPWRKGGAVHSIERDEGPDRVAGHGGVEREQRASEECGDA